MKLARYHSNQNAKTRSEPKVVGRARTEFGTRLSLRVTCEKCQKTDHVSVRVNDKQSRLCRDCAEVFLAAYEQGRAVTEKKIKENCNHCGVLFTVSEIIAQKKQDLLCNDCLRGFYVFRGKIQSCQTAPKKERSILTKASEKTAFRKTLHDNI